MSNISAESKDLITLFNDTFVIPEYQRPYRWEEHDVKKILIDVERSLHSISRDAQRADKDFRFLGSLVGVSQLRHDDQTMSDAQVSWYELVDGQQRIITFTLIVAVLYKKIIEIAEKINEVNNNELEIKYKTIIEKFKKQMYGILVLKTDSDVYTRVIRYENDRWNKTYINKGSDYVKAIRCFLKGNNISNAGLNNQIIMRNIDVINDYIDKYLSNEKYEDQSLDTDENVNDIQNIDFNWVVDCIANIKQNNLWNAEYKVIKDRLEQQKNNSVLNEIEIQLLKIILLTYYLTKRCRFILIQTGVVEWAFDMFISLNTTGVSLNAIEIFKAYMLQKARLFNQENYILELNKSIGTVYRGDYGIEPYFDEEQDSKRKQRRVNEYITFLALSYNGEKLAFDLRDQREWLIKIFDKFHNQQEDLTDRYNQQLAFHLRLQYLTQYLVNFAKQMRNPTSIIDGFNKLSDSDLLDRALLSLAYLKDVNHTIIHATLSRYYEKIIINIDNEDVIQYHAREFAEVIIAIAAFYTLWKSIRGTSGLDNVYRDYLEQHLSYKKVKYEIPSSREFKQNLWKHFNDALKKDLGTNDSVGFEDWYNRASRNIRYSNSGMKTVCRYILFVCAHDTQMRIPGIVKPTISGVRPFLNIHNWKSPSLNSIEHVAPQTSDGNWDSKLYGGSGMWDSIGNLLLFPSRVNSSLSNASWSTKWLYYSHLAATTPEQRKTVKNLAIERNINLSDSTLGILTDASYAGHINDVIALGIDGRWDAQIVEQRSKNILQIFYTRMHEILNITE